MRILHFLPDLAMASFGVSSYINSLTRVLGRSVDFHIVTSHTHDEISVENCTVHFISAKWVPRFSTKKEFCDILDEVSPDVFHTNSCWVPMSGITAIWAKQRGYKVVYTPHGMLEPWILKRHYLTRKLPALLLYQKRAIKAADMLHATADSEKDSLLRLGYNKNVCVISNGVDVDLIDMKTSWDRKGVILFLSRIHVKKGIELLIEAVSKIKKEHDCPLPKIVLAGEGEQVYISHLEQLMRERGVLDNFEFVGGVYGDNKWNLFRKADMFVLPSYSENFGIVVAEALACGTPVLTTKGTPWADLEDRSCGWWIETDVEAIIGAIKHFLSLSAVQLEEMGRNGRALVEEKYSTQHIAQQFLSMYEGLSDRCDKV